MRRFWRICSLRCPASIVSTESGKAVAVEGSPSTAVKIFRDLRETAAVREGVLALPQTRNDIDALPFSLKTRPDELKSLAKLTLTIPRVAGILILEFGQLPKCGRTSVRVAYTTGSSFPIDPVWRESLITPPRADLTSNRLVDL